MRFSRLTPLAFALSAFGSAAAQQPRQLTAEDYGRAERFLGASAVPLVSGLSGPPRWLDDGRFWYRSTIPNGSAFFVVDPARKTRTQVFDQTRLAAALAAASGGRVEGTRLPFQSFDLAKDNRSITVSLQQKRWTCDLQRYTCAAADSSATASRRARLLIARPSRGAMGAV